MENPFEVLALRLERIEASILELAKVPRLEDKPPEKYLTTDQVCELLNITRVTLWAWDKKGITSPLRIGNLKRYRLSDIEAKGE